MAVCLFVVLTPVLTSTQRNARAALPRGTQVVWGFRVCVLCVVYVALWRRAVRAVRNTIAAKLARQSVVK